MTVLSFQGIFVIGCGIVGSIAFLLLPGFNDLLYVTGSHFVGTTRVTVNEWIWILVITPLCVVWTMGMRRSRQTALSSDDATATITTKCTRFLFASKLRTLRVFVMVNLLWFLASIGRPFATILRDAAPETPSSDIWWDVVEMIGAKAAWPAMWNLALVVFPVCRTSSLLSSSCGMSPREALPLHYWAANALLFWLAVHTTVLSLVYFLRKAKCNSSEWLSLMIPLGGRYTEGVVNFMGWMGMFFFAALWIFSRPCVREKAFNVFYGMHFVLAALAILFSHLHDYNVLFFVQPAFISWVVDLNRRHSSKLTLFEKGDEETTNSKSFPACSYSLRFEHNPRPHGRFADCAILRATQRTEAAMVALTIPIPTEWLDKLSPNMFVYLNCPSLSNREYHPFSIGSIDRSSRSMTIYIKPLGDWTSSFVRKIHYLCNKANTKEGRDRDNRAMGISEGGDALFHENALLELNLEGPYGGCSLSKTLEDCDRCVFLAGGAGFTGVMSLVENRQNAGRESTLIWLSKSAAEACFFGECINRLRNRPLGYLTKVKVFLTGTSPSNVSEELVDASIFRSQAFTVVTDPSYSHGMAEMAEWHTIASAFLGIIVGLLMGRLLCHSEHLHVNGVRMTRCSLLFSSSLCIVCDAEDPIFPDDNEIPCCESAVCFYCFRGAPMILTCFFVPLFAYMSIQFRWWVLRWRSNPCYTSAESVMSVVESDGDTDDRDTMFLPNEAPEMAHDRQDDTPCTYSAFEIHRERACIPEVLKNLFEKGDTGDGDHGEEIPEKTALVLCGPKLMRKTAHKFCAKKYRSVRIFHID